MTELQQTNLNKANEMLLRRSKEVIKAELDYKNSRYLSNNFKKAKDNALNKLHVAVQEVENITFLSQQKLFS